MGESQGNELLLATAETNDTLMLFSGNMSLMAIIPAKRSKKCLTESLGEN